MNKFLILTLLFFNVTLANINYMSQVGQDKFLNENFFHNKKNGVFLDIGAHDGITLSNTYFFEKSLNWSGICIEPMKVEFDKLKKIRKTICINCCAATVDGFQPFLLVEGKVNVLSGLVNTYHPLHLARLKIEIERYGGSYKIINVYCRKINDILNENKITKIDYLSIDTEGGEFEILNSIDFEKIKIYAISVEDNYGDPRIKKLLESKNFNFVIRLGQLDDIYVNHKNK